VLNKEKALHPPAASVGSFYFYASPEQAQLGLKTSKYNLKKSANILKIYAGL